MKTLIFIILSSLLAVPAFSQSQTKLEKRDSDAIISVIQEEKVAHDFYEAMYQAHGLVCFRSISKSEGIHMEMVKLLLDVYDIPDPLVDHYYKPGSFKDKKFERLFDDMLRKGSSSIIDALIESARFEELDIYDLETFADITSQTNVRDTFLELSGVSRNHLWAIVKSLEERGVDYEPAVLPARDLNKIITSK